MENALAKAVYKYHEDKLDVVRKLLRNDGDPNGIVARSGIKFNDNIWV